MNIEKVVITYKYIVIKYNARIKYYFRYFK